MPPGEEGVEGSICLSDLVVGRRLVELSWHCAAHEGSEDS